MKGWEGRMWNAVFKIQDFYYISNIIVDVANS